MRKITKEELLKLDDIEKIRVLKLIALGKIVFIK